MTQIAKRSPGHTPPTLVGEPSTSTFVKPPSERYGDWSPRALVWSWCARRGLLFQIAPGSLKGSKCRAYQLGRALVKRIRHKPKIDTELAGRCGKVRDSISNTRVTGWALTEVTRSLTSPSSSKISPSTKFLWDLPQIRQYSDHPGSVPRKWRRKLTDATRLRAPRPGVGGPWPGLRKAHLGVPVATARRQWLHAVKSGRPSATTARCRARSSERSVRA